MTADEWAEVFRAGAEGIGTLSMIRNEALPPALYGPAAVNRALAAMSAKCAEIAGRP